MKINKLHVVSFDVPFPPDYGGVIDVFYKLKEFKKLAIEITLHTFEYGRGEQEELKKYCAKIYYYKRNSFVKSFVSKEPFMVKSRNNNRLIRNLTSDSSPILFEGLHTTLPIFLNKITNQKTFVRAHNVEHFFYRGLAKSESNILKKIFYKSESNRLVKYEQILNKVDGVFPISLFEQVYFVKKYGEKAVYIPPFHEVIKNMFNADSSKIILYHGNLKVSENVKAALYLINVYKESNFSLVIASGFQNREVSSQIKKHDNIRFEVIKSNNDLDDLLTKAHINALPTFQKTGIKLKLINTLYKGRFVIANRFMVEDTGLKDLVRLANSKKEFLKETESLFKENFDNEHVVQRLAVLENFNPEKSAQKMIDVIFN